VKGAKSHKTSVGLEHETIKGDIIIGEEEEDDVNEDDLKEDEDEDSLWTLAIRNIKKEKLKEKELEDAEEKLPVVQASLRLPPSSAPSTISSLSSSISSSSTTATSTPLSSVISLSPVQPELQASSTQTPPQPPRQYTQKQIQNRECGTKLFEEFLLIGQLIFDHRHPLRAEAGRIVGYYVTAEGGRDLLPEMKNVDRMSVKTLARVSLSLSKLDEAIKDINKIVLICKKYGEVQNDKFRKDPRHKARIIRGKILGAHSRRFKEERKKFKEKLSSEEYSEIKESPIKETTIPKINNEINKPETFDPKMIEKPETYDPNFFSDEEPTSPDGAKNEKPQVLDNYF